MRLRRIASFACGLAALVASAPVSAEVLADCGASKGKAFYPVEGSWSDDGISKGSFIITVDGAAPNVLFRDASGTIVDAKADGADVRFAHMDAERGEFGIVASYKATGVIETYNVRTGEKGRELFWTSNKTGKRGVAKVAAFVAPCR
jgi:hypothetical protein